jgi:murein DD-endopeptidase MepM/ murein hydrolase activator NlpD
MIKRITVTFLIFNRLMTSLPQTLESPLSGLIIVNQYLAPLTPYSNGHRGIDIEAQPNEEILSPATGTISFVGKVGYRNLITISFDDKKTSLEPVCSELTEGTLVTQGEVIGTLCQPDPEYQWHCNQTCLHFGIRNTEGYFSPLALIGGLPPSRLVP